VSADYIAHPMSGTSTIFNANNIGREVWFLDAARSRAWRNDVMHELDMGDVAMVYNGEDHDGYSILVRAASAP